MNISKNQSGKINIFAIAETGSETTATKRIPTENMRYGNFKGSFLNTEFSSNAILTYLLGIGIGNKQRPREVRNTDTR